MNRRSFLSRSLLGAASLGVGTLPFGRVRSANAAGPLPTPYPVLAITISGGWDSAMHLVATPNGRFGDVTIENRLPSSSFITTSSGITYVPSVVTPTGKTQFKDHLKDVALIRAVEGSGFHGAIAATWFGRVISDSGDRFRRLPWASQLAAQFRERGLIVPKPVSVAYFNRPQDVTPEPFRDLVSYGTQIPDPATRPDRISSVRGFFDAIETTGLPPPGLQKEAYDLIDALDQRGPLLTQDDYAARFTSANKATREVLGRVAAGPAWPPSPANITALGLDPTKLNADLAGVAPSAVHMFALTYQALANNLSHVIGFRLNSPADSHIENVIRQTTLGVQLWPALGRLITLMKATTSPIDPSKSLFDTTNIWISSEMGRSAEHEVFTTGPLAGVVSGTRHWRPNQAVFMGGRFKRGVAIGGFTPKWQAKKVNPATGLEAGGITLGFENSIATVMKAAGGDPSQFTNAAPVDAILDMSR